MTLKAAMWVHGTIVQAESPTSSSVRTGGGTEFSAGGPSLPPVLWFHIPIPTPVILDGVRPELGKVLVLYKTNLATTVKSIHIYDGPTKVWALDGLDLRGDHSAELDESNTWIIEPSIPIRFGLGISVGVTFSFDTPSSILFTSAGADFLTP